MTKTNENEVTDSSDDFTEEEQAYLSAGFPLLLISEEEEEKNEARHDKNK